jgi:prepilin peptidase CpaA
MPEILKLALVALVLAAAAYDFIFRRIPNWLNVSGALLGLGLNAFLFAGHGIAVAALGLMLPLAIYLPLYVLKAMGAGDVKLMAAVGAIVGPRQWIAILVCTAIAGGLLAVALSIAKGRLRHTLFNVMLLVRELFHFRAPAKMYEELNVRDSQSLRLPHGVAIAAGSLAFLVLLA